MQKSKDGYTSREKEQGRESSVNREEMEKAEAGAVARQLNDDGELAKYAIEGTEDSMQDLEKNILTDFKNDNPNRPINKENFLNWIPTIVNVDRNLKKNEKKAKQFLNIQEWCERLQFLNDFGKFDYCNPKYQEILTTLPKKNDNIRHNRNEQMWEALWHAIEPKENMEQVSAAKKERKAIIQEAYTLALNERTPEEHNFFLGLFNLPQTGMIDPDARNTKIAPFLSFVMKEGTIPIAHKTTKTITTIRNGSEKITTTTDTDELSNNRKTGKTLVRSKAIHVFEDAALIRRGLNSLMGRQKKLQDLLKSFDLPFNYDDYQKLIDEGKDNVKKQTIRKGGKKTEITKDTGNGGIETVMVE